MNSIQHKFLISPDITRWLKQQKVKENETEQFYIKSEEGSKCYYLKHFPDSYSETIVNVDGIEQQSSIDDIIYMEKMKQHVGRKAHKKTYTIEVTNEAYVFYEYLDDLKGLYLLVASFKDNRIERESTILEDLQAFVLKKVDKESKYEAEALCLCVKPMEYSLEKHFEKIDAYESVNLFFWQVPSRIYVRDGVVLVIYKNIRLLQHYKVNFHKKHHSASLHRLRVIMRRTATILESFPDIFQANMQQVCIDMLVRFHEQSKLLRYIYFLEELYTTTNHAKISIYSELKSLMEAEEHAVLQMLHSAPFKQTVQILTREIQNQNYQQCNTLTDKVKDVARKHLLAFEDLLQKTKDGHDDEMLDEIFIAMDSVQTIIEDFFHILGEKKMRIIVDEINILLKPLREYRNCKERAAILAAMAKESGKDILLDDNPLLCKNMKALQKKITTALKLLRGSKFYV